MRYRFLSQHFFDGRLYEPGEEIDFPGVPTPDMEPLDDEAKAKSDQAIAEYVANSGVGFMKRDFHDDPRSTDEEPEVIEPT